MAHTIYKNNEGKRLPSVTTIIGENLGWNKNILLAWQAREFKAGNDPTSKSKKACDIGTLCHHFISSDFFNKEIDEEMLLEYNTDAILIAENALKQCKKKFEENNFKITHSEIQLISELYQYGGIIDAILVKGNKIILSDFKTSNKSKYNPHGIYSDHLIQLGAYNNLCIENKIVIPDEYLFIHINKDITTKDEDIIELVPVKKEIIELGFETFKKLLELNKIQKQLIIE